MTENYKKYKKKLIIITMSLIILLVLGFAYAYIYVVVRGNDESSQNILLGADFQLTLNGALDITGEIKRPGQSITKQFTVTNSGNDAISSYGIYFSNVTNSLINVNDLVYTISCSSSINGVNNGSCTGKSESVFPTNVIQVLTGDAIAVGEVHTYTLVISYNETNSDQSSDMGASFNTKITIGRETLVDAVKNANGILNANGYRYQGANPNNYISFNNETWRIIGVFSEDDHGIAGTELVKIIKDESIGNMAWDSNNENNWETSSLNTYLNGTSGTDYYGSIDNTYKSMIEEATWYLGGMSEINTDPNYWQTTASNWYTYERGSIVYSENPTSTVDKIGLMYMSDYGYASSGCYSSINLDVYYSSPCTESNWLFKGNDEWTIASSSSYSNHVWHVYMDGSASNFVTNEQFPVRPVLYLDPSVYLLAGIGSESSPYIIEMQTSTHLITKGTETNGTFTIDKNEAETGEIVTVTPTPATGYIVSSVLINGNATGVINNDTNYTFTMPTENVTVTVEFSRPTLVSVVKSANGILNENGYRYQGANPNNYITFNNETWRIIGVFDEDDHGIADTELVKIIRNEFAENVNWSNNYLNNWTISSLNTYLNGTSGTDYYGSINNTFKNMIEEVTWYLGGVSGTNTDPNYYEATASTWYTYERGNIVYGTNPTSTIGNIGLMYMSDYAYASSECYSSVRLNTYNYSSATCIGSNWLYNETSEWIITHNSNNDSNVWAISGNIHEYYVGSINSYRPVLYLDPSVYVTGTGVGSSANPYTIGM